MRRIELTLEATTPVFLNGSDPDGEPEVRAPSVRGQIRFWLRALEGAKSANLEDVWQQEKRVLGSTEAGSRVSIRFYTDAEIVHYKTRVLRHGQKAFQRSAIKPGHSLKLEILARPGDEIPKEVQDAVKIWLLLGGIGKRSRRMFGAFEVRNWDAQFWGTGKPATAQQYKALVTKCLNSALGDPQGLQGVYGPAKEPSFSTLHPAHCQILVSGDSWASWEDPMLWLFEDWLRSNKKGFLSHADSFGYAYSDSRRASPLVAQVRRIDGECYPVLTLMRSHVSEGRKAHWDVLRKFMQEVAKDLNGITAWGTL